MEPTGKTRPDPGGSLGSRVSDLVDRCQITAILRLTERLQRGSLEIVLPDGGHRLFAGAGAGPHGVLRLNNGRVARRYLMAGSVGFGEGYIEGDWETPDLARLLAVLSLNEEAWSDGYSGGPWHRFVRRRQHSLRPNTHRGSRRNGQAHYDLGNEFFGAWLDRP